MNVNVVMDDYHDMMCGWSRLMNRSLTIEMSSPPVNTPIPRNAHHPYNTPCRMLQRRKKKKEEGKKGKHDISITNFSHEA